MHSKNYNLMNWTTRFQTLLDLYEQVNDTNFKKSFDLKYYINLIETDKEYLQKIARLNISVEAFIVIHPLLDYGHQYVTNFYLDNCYQNRELRDFLRQYCDCLEYYLNELELFQDQIVYRHWNSIKGEDKNKFFDFFKSRIGILIFFPQQLSCSIEYWGSEICPATFKINTNVNTNAVLTSKILDVFQPEKKEYEREITIKPRTIFKVISVDKDFVALDEISSKSNKNIAIRLGYNFWEKI